MASSKISELVDGGSFLPGDDTIIVRNGANFKVDPTKNAVQAWVNFNGTGTVAIRESYNVSSITDNGTGDYTVNFTNALTDANYSTIATTNWRGSGSFDFINMHNSRVATTTSVSFLTGSTSAFLDSSILNIAIIR